MRTFRTRRSFSWKAKIPLCRDLQCDRYPDEELPDYARQTIAATRSPDYEVLIRLAR